jgi:hypothetical protein
MIGLPWSGESQPQQMVLSLRDEQAERKSLVLFAAKVILREGNSASYFDWERMMSSAEQPAPGTPSKEQLKAAFKAFKRRLKLTRLDEESSIAGGPLSGGRGSAIVAITPPNEYPQAVWDELVRQGRLCKAGHGTYELAEP